jgi:hypothetical protein
LLPKNYSDKRIFRVSRTRAGQYPMTPCGRHKFGAIKDAVISVNCRNYETSNEGLILERYVC